MTAFILSTSSLRRRSSETSLWTVTKHSTARVVQTLASASANFLLAMEQSVSALVKNSKRSPSRVSSWREWINEGNVDDVWGGGGAKEILCYILEGAKKNQRGHLPQQKIVNIVTNTTCLPLEALLEYQQSLIRRFCFSPPTLFSMKVKLCC